MSTSMLKASTGFAALCAAWIGLHELASACGFLYVAREEAYAAKADARLFNNSSKVVLTRSGIDTTMTVAGDYHGDLKEFAVVIPVPTFIERKQIGIVDMKTIDRLDDTTAPRLVEYYDTNPCPRDTGGAAGALKGAGRPLMAGAAPPKAGYHGVTVEANYDVGEYDVYILSATESDGLGHWLRDNGYRIPQGAEPILASYIKQNMRFFVAKVNLDRMQLLANQYLRPLQVRFATPKFMLPLRLGTINANRPQDLIVYALSDVGRVETTNYRTVKMPSHTDVPLFVKNDFGNFYKAVFEQAVKRENMRAVFVEYAQSLESCASTSRTPWMSCPLTAEQWVELGARWIAGGSGPVEPRIFVTRLHVRYDAASFPEDLMFMPTSDHDHFSSTYIVRHPWTGAASCPEADRYLAQLQKRMQKQASNLATLTGWSPQDIAARMQEPGSAAK